MDPEKSIYNNSTYNEFVNPIEKLTLETKPIWMFRKLVILSIILLFIPSICISQDTLIRGVEIHVTSIDDIFPENWYDEDVDATVELLENSEIQRTYQILDIALSKYPDAVLEEFLEKIYILKDMKFYGVGYGGTNFTGKVYLSNDGESNGYTNLFIEKVFHAEFSSLFYVELFTDEMKEEWASINKRNFEYGTNGRDALISGRSSEKFTAELHEIGFLTEYGMSSMENDFNSIAKNIFTGQRELWEIVESYDRIAKKVDLFIDFYHGLDTLFTREYFEGLVQE